MDAVASAASAVSTAAELSQKFSDNANKALALLIDKVSSGIDQATSFLAAQIPDVIHQLLVYNLVVSALLCGFSLVVAIVLPVIWWKIKVWAFSEKNQSRYGMKDGVQVCFGLSTFFGSIAEVAFVNAFFNHFDWLEIWLAPKIWLIQYAANLVKTATGH
jgi:hypothetical protein